MFAINKNSSTEHLLSMWNFFKNELANKNRDATYKRQVKNVVKQIEIEMYKRSKK